MEAINSEVEQTLLVIGYTRVEYIIGDHIPPGFLGPESEWSKWIFKPPAGQRPTNVHVRVAGRPNQHYPILFRDYLRDNPMAAQAYARVKMALASLHPDDVDAYYNVKDPVCDIIIAGAELWAASGGWEMGSSDV